MAYGIGRWIAGHHHPDSALDEPTLKVTNGILHATEEPNAGATYKFSGSVPYQYFVRQPFSLGMVLFFSPAYTPPGSGTIHMGGHLLRFPDGVAGTTSGLIQTTNADMSAIPEYTIFQFSGRYTYSSGFFPIGPGEPFIYSFNYGGAPGDGTGIHLLGLDMWVP